MTQFLPDPLDPSVYLIGQATEEVFGVRVWSAVLTHVHPAWRCQGRPCVVHHPSEHHMQDWPIDWRADRGTVERTCPHMIGHPDPDDLAYQLSLGRSLAGVHGCDGCCAA